VIDNKPELLKALMPISVKVPGKSIFVSAVQDRKAPCLMLVIVLGNSTDANWRQLLKALVGISVIEFGMLIDVKPASWKTELPKEVTESGIVMVLRFKQLTKAEPPMDKTEFGIVMPVRLTQLSNALLPILVTAYCTPLWVTVAGMLATPEKKVCVVTPELKPFLPTSTVKGSVVLVMLYLIPSKVKVCAKLLMLSSNAKRK